MDGQRIRTNNCLQQGLNQWFSDLVDLNIIKQTPSAGIVTRFLLNNNPENI